MELVPITAARVPVSSPAEQLFLSPDYLTASRWLPTAAPEATAIALYRRAVGLGNSNAMNNLAWMLQLGRGVERKNPEEAADLMLKALELRNEFAYRQMTQNSRAWGREFRQALQAKLRDAGVYSGKIDGELRDTSIAAINAYINRKR